MRFIIRENEEATSAFVANYIAERIRHFSPTPAHPFVLGLPTGSSPLGVYRKLVEKYKAGEVRDQTSLQGRQDTRGSPGIFERQISFENVVTFNMVWHPSLPACPPGFGPVPPASTTSRSLA